MPGQPMAHRRLPAARSPTEAAVDARARFAPSPTLPRRHILRLALAASLLPRPAPAGARQGTAIAVALDWYPNANHAGLFLADATGGFAAEGLAVALATPPDPTVVLQTVGAGRDDLGISYQTDVLLARAAGVPVVAIAALVQRPLLGVMSLRSAGIARPADLVGQTVGMTGIPSQEAFLTTMLTADGADPAAVERVDVGFDLLPALVSGRAAAVMGAYWSHETIVAEQAGFPVDLLRVEQWGVPPYYELVLVASESTVAERPALASAFLRATQRGYAAAAADPTAALAALAAASPELDRAVEAAGLALLTPVWTEGVAVFGDQSPARWADYADWMAGQGLIPADLDPAAAFTTALLPRPVPAATPAATPAP